MISLYQRGSEDLIYTYGVGKFTCNRKIICKQYQTLHPEDLIKHKVTKKNIYAELSGSEYERWRTINSAISLIASVKVRAKQ